MLDVRAHGKAQGWEEEQAVTEFRRRGLVELDLTAVSIPTAVFEFKKIWDARLDYFIERLLEVAQYQISIAPDRKKLRLYHIFISDCTDVLKHPEKDVGTAVRDLEKEAYKKPPHT